MAARAVRPAVALVLGAGLAACAVSPEDCDPGQVNNVGQSLGCDVFGSYDARQAALREEVRATVARTELTRDETAALSAEAARLAADREAWRDRRIALANELADLDRELERTRAANATQQAELDALQEELAEAEAELARRGPDAATEAEIEALVAEVERKKRAVEIYRQSMTLVE